MKLKNKFFKKLLKKFHKFNCSPPYLIIYIIIILYIYILASLGSTILLTTNVYIQLSIWIITIYFAIKLQNNFILFIPIIIYLINEILYSRFNIDLYKDLLKEGKIKKKVICILFLSYDGVCFVNISTLF